MISQPHGKEIRANKEEHPTVVGNNNFTLLSYRCVDPSHPRPRLRPLISPLDCYTYRTILFIGFIQTMMALLVIRPQPIFWL